jgi:hypothetical protein
MNLSLMDFVAISLSLHNSINSFNIETIFGNDLVER